MAGRPCFGPCDPSVVDWIAYGALVAISGVLVVALYLISRRARPDSRFGWIVACAVAIVAAVIVVPRYPRPSFTPAAIRAGLAGSGDTDSFYLAGTYAVGWTAEA